MRAAALDAQGYVRNFIEVTPRDLPAGAVLVPAGTPVTFGWRYWRGLWSAPDVEPEPEPEPTRDIEAEYADKAEAASTVAGLRAVLRDYLRERSASN